MSQIALPLDTTPKAENSGFLVTAANIAVCNQLENWQAWPHMTAILVGPQSSGKSAILESFSNDSGGYIMDDADSREDEVIFHLWNRAREEQKPLLLTSRMPVSEWSIVLPDLKSRLASSLLLELGPPDEEMIAGLMQQYFVRRGLSISEDALAYLAKRMQRSYRFVELLAAKMDNIAIEQKKPVTLAVARAALAEQQSGNGPDI